MPHATERDTLAAPSDEPASLVKNRMDTTSPTATSRYSWYVVCVLLMVYMVHHLDRMVLTLLLEPIGREFRFSDSELGLLAGLAYAVPFAVAGLPLGMLADRVNRVRLLTVLVTIWSGLTALASMATGFWTLLLVRVGVAAAEAGGTPTNISIITDQVPAARRSSAFGVYYMGAGLGTVIGFAAAGAAAAAYGWRAGFLVAGLPGLVLAVVVAMTLRDPPRRREVPTDPIAPPPIGQAIRMIWVNKPALHMMAGTAIIGMFGIGLTTWLPALMIRGAGADVGKVGAIMAFAIAPLGALSAFIGGRVGDALYSRSRASIAAFLIGATVVVIVATVAGIASPSLTGLVVGFAIHTFAQLQISAPAYSIVMHYVAPEIRAVATSLIQVGTNVLGFGVGAQLIGLLSDSFHPWAGGESLRYAMLAFSITGLWAVLHFVFAARAVHVAEGRRNSP